MTRYPNHSRGEIDSMTFEAIALHPKEDSTLVALRRDDNDCLELTFFSTFDGSILCDSPGSNIGCEAVACYHSPSISPNGRELALRCSNYVYLYSLDSELFLDLKFEEFVDGGRCATLMPKQWLSARTPRS